MLPLIVHLYVLTLISVMTFSCRIHSSNDDDDDDDDDIYPLLCPPPWGAPAKMFASGALMASRVVVSGMARH